MTLRLGRVTLSVAQGVGLDIRRVGDAVGTRRKARQYSVTGRERGSGAAALVTALEKEYRRYGCIWVEDDEATIVAGYYKLIDGPMKKPGGAPKFRPWTLALQEELVPPVVTRQAEDDNPGGTDTADANADEGFYVSRTGAVGTPISIMQPRTVSGAERFNLPAGEWSCSVQVAKVSADIQWRWRLTDLAGTTIATGAFVTVASTVFVDVSLGKLIVPVANHKANWFEVEQQSTSGTSTGFTDRARFYPVGSV